MKTCTSCGEIKLPEGFHKHFAGRTERLTDRCKMCYIERAREYSNKYAQKGRESLSDWYVKALLGMTGRVSKKLITHKREQLSLHRLANGLKQAIKEKSDE